MYQTTLTANQARVVNDATESRGFYVNTGKRILDVALAILIMPFAGIIIAALWVIVRRDGGSGFFGHKRIGLDGKEFKCWKIRTMVMDAETKLEAYLKENPKAAAEWEKDHKLTDDPRINRIGHFLRKSSLDELPQIWNVLKGEMSFVGPRPVVAKEIEKYGVSVAYYLAQKPGITGLWQVSGRNDLTYDERVDLDVQYFKARGFASDVNILLKTVLEVIGKGGR